MYQRNVYIKIGSPALRGLWSVAKRFAVSVTGSRRMYCNELSLIVAFYGMRGRVAVRAHEFLALCCNNMRLLAVDSLIPLYTLFFSN